MVVETIAEREETASAVLKQVQTSSVQEFFADDIALALNKEGIDSEVTLRTIWRLVDENRLFFDAIGHLTVKKPRS